jgi:hypothetical protein
MSVDKGNSVRLRNNAVEAPRREPNRPGFTESAGPNVGFVAGPPVSACSRANGSRKIAGKDPVNGKFQILSFGLAARPHGNGRMEVGPLDTLGGSRQRW